MAGTNQAANLTGMLSQIGGSLRAGVSQENIDKLGGVVERMSKPELDMNDPESIKRNAQWYHATGKDREAMALGEKAAAMEAQKAEGDALNTAMGMFQTGQNGVNAGYTNDVLKAQRGIREAAMSVRDPAAKLQLNNMANQLQNQVPQARTQEMSNDLVALNKMDAFLNDTDQTNQMDPRAFEAIKQNRQRVFEKPGVAQKFEEQQLQAVKQSADLIRNQAVIDDKKVRTEYAQVAATNSPEALAAFEKKVTDEGNGAILQNIKNEVTRAKTFELELGEATRNAAAANAKYEIPSSLSNIVAELPKNPEGDRLRAAYKGLEADTAKYNDSKGDTNNSDVYAGAGIKGLNETARVLFQQASSMDSEATTNRTASITALNTQIRNANKSLRTVSATQEEVINRARNLGGIEKSRDIGEIYTTTYEDEAGDTGVTLYEAARQLVLQEKRLNYQAVIDDANAQIATLQSAVSGEPQTAADKLTAAIVANGGTVE